MGFLCAFITSLFFTAYTIPKKLSGQSTTVYSLFQAIGYFGCACIVYPLHCIIRGAQAEPLSDPRLLWSALSGTAWFFGCVFFFLSIDEMGLTRSNQWKNLQGPFGAVFNLIFLAEYQQTNVLFILLSCGFILLSAMLLAIRNPGTGNQGQAGNAGATGRRSGVSGRGIFYAILAAVLFGLNSMLLKQGTNFGFLYSQQFVLSGTVFVCAAVFLPVKERHFIRFRDFAVRDNLLGILGGILYFAALSFSLMSYRVLPGSVTFTIIQLNSVWTVLAGVFLFHEIDFRSNRNRILSGMLCAVIGVIMLMFA